MSIPNVSGKQRFDSVYDAVDFVAHLRLGGWDPGTLPEAVIFTYAGFDLLCAALPDEFTMNPMLGPGPGRFFTSSVSEPPAVSPRITAALATALTDAGIDVQSGPT